MNPRNMKFWNEEDKPREKLLSKGAFTLSNAELLAILLNTGSRDKPVLEVAFEILQVANGNLLELQEVTLNQLKNIKGVGTKKAITILAAFELSKRIQVSKMDKKIKIQSSQTLFQVLKPHFTNFKSEQFLAIYLNSAHHVLKIEKISQGGTQSTVVDPKIIFQKALEQNGATKFAVAHNHPSGNIKPSNADIEITKKLFAGGKLLDLSLLDHLIVGYNEYFSFADEELMAGL